MILQNFRQSLHKLVLLSLVFSSGLFVVAEPLSAASNNYKFEKIEDTTVFVYSGPGSSVGTGGMDETPENPWILPDFTITDAVVPTSDNSSIPPVFIITDSVVLTSDNPWIAPDFTNVDLGSKPMILVPSEVPTAECPNGTWLYENTLKCAASSVVPVAPTNPEAPVNPVSCGHVPFMVGGYDYSKNVVPNSTATISGVTYDISSSCIATAGSATPLILANPEAPVTPISCGHVPFMVGGYDYSNGIVPNSTSSIGGVIYDIDSSCNAVKR